MSDMMNQLRTAMQAADDINELSNESGKFFAILLTLNLNDLEASLLDGLTKYEELRKECKIEEINTNKAGDMAALIGCCIRFRDDVAENTKLGRECFDKYKQMKAVLNT